MMMMMFIGTETLVTASEGPGAQGLIGEAWAPGSEGVPDCCLVRTTVMETQLFQKREFYVEIGF